MVDQLDLMMFDCPCCGDVVVCVGERPLINCEHCGELVPVPTQNEIDCDSPPSLN